MSMLQTLKYFLVRTGISLLLLLVFGYSVLYLIHEIALPQLQFDDTLIQWALLLICTFIGFLAYGMIGEQKIHNAIHSLKDVGPLDDQEETIRQFENLLHFTESAYFLPGQARRFRGLVVRKYADYLFSIGREEADALKIYLKAFLQNPKNSKFRAPLLSILAQGGDLTESEIDLLLVMLRAEDFQDAFIIHHLASVFLRQEKFTPKTESVFLYAVESECKESREILRFVIPILLANQRSDMNALRFYLQSLPLNLPEQDTLREILARTYCEGHLEVVDPVMQTKCAQAFHALDADRKASIRESVEENRLSGRVKKVKLVSRDDIQDISRWKARLGIEKTIIGKMGAAIMTGVRWIPSLGRKLLLWAVDGLIAFGRTRLTVKLISVSALCLLILAGLGVRQWQEAKKQIVENPVAPKEVALPPPKQNHAQPAKVHSVQIAAVTSSKQADSFVKNLKKKGVKEIYIVKSPRQAGGSWYKIRVGKFDRKEDALKLANRLMDDKIIKNYFVVSMPKIGNSKREG